MKYPASLEKLIKCFSLYPGIGPKTAERLAFYTVSKMDKSTAMDFSKAIEDALLLVGRCKICGHICEGEVCSICKDNSRTKQIMVVEDAKDVIAFESLGVYKGKYHCLNGLISPMKGIGPEDIGIDKLLKRVEDEKIEEVILSLSSTVSGETTALYIKKLLANLNVKVYKIGYGIPVGANIEYIDEITLLKALEGKHEM